MVKIHCPKRQEKKLGNWKISAPLNKRGSTYEYNGPPPTGKGMPK